AYVCFAHGRVRVAVVGEAVYLGAVGRDQFSRDTLRIVRLTDRREVEQHLHGVSADVDELRRVCELRAGRQVAVFGDLVESDDVGVRRRNAVATGDHQVADR